MITDFALFARGGTHSNAFSTQHAQVLTDTKERFPSFKSVVQFWFEIILVNSDHTRATRSFDFEITRMISDQVALHSVQLPLLILKEKYKYNHAKQN